MLNNSTSMLWLLQLTLFNYILNVMLVFFCLSFSYVHKNMEWMFSILCFVERSLIKSVLNFDWCYRQVFYIRSYP